MKLLVDAKWFAGATRMHTRKCKHVFRATQYVHAIKD